jgi:hypothetical protein
MSNTVPPDAASVDPMAIVVNVLRPLTIVGSHDWRTIANSLNVG